MADVYRQDRPTIWGGHEGQTRGTRMRAPKNLPLRPVEVGVNVWPADLAAGQTWPPPRCDFRTRRFEQQFAAANGQYREWLDVDVSINHVAAWITAVAELLCDTPPEIPGVDEDASICLVERLVWDYLVHGRCLLIGQDGQLIAPDIRFAWPFAAQPDSWVTVVPVIGEGSGSASDPTAADVLIYAAGMVGGSRREYSATDTIHADGGQLGAEQATYAAMPATIGHADRGPARGLWGRSGVDDLLPIIVEMARRESGWSHVLDINEHPIFVTEVNSDDMKGLEKLMTGFLTGTATDQPDARTLQRLAPVLRELDVLVAPTGLNVNGYESWDGDMTGTEGYVNRLEMLFCRHTGMMPIEAADSADVPSGVAVGRREGRFVVKTRKMWRAFKALIERVHGQPIVWDFANTLASAAGEDDPADDPAGDMGGDDG